MFFFVIVVITLAVMGSVINSSAVLNTSNDVIYNQHAMMLENTVASLTRAIKDYQLDNFERFREWECIEVSGICSGNYKRVINDSGYGGFTADTWDIELYPAYLGLLNVPSQWALSVEHKTNEVYACFWKKNGTGSPSQDLTRLEVIKRFYERTNKHRVSVGDTGCNSTTPMVTTNIDSLNRSQLYFTYTLTEKDI